MRLTQSMPGSPSVWSEIDDK